MDLASLEGVHDEENNCDANTGIGDIERGPWIGKTDVQIEKQKIDDVTVQQPVREIAQNPGEQERKRNIAPQITHVRAQQE
jgi:hypothetical protein